MNENLSLVERTEIAGLGIAELDHAKQLVVDGIGDGHGVGELLGRVEAVVMADRNVGNRRRARRLSRPCARAGRKDGAGKEKADGNSARPGWLLLPCVGGPIL